MTITTTTNTRAHHGDQAITPSMDNNNSETVQKKGETGYGDACGHSLLCAHFDRKGVNCNTPYRDCKCDKQNMDLHDTHLQCHRQEPHQQEHCVVSCWEDRYVPCLDYQWCLL